MAVTGSAAVEKLVTGTRPGRALARRNLDRQHLILEAPGVYRGDGALVALQREGVLLLAADLVLLGDILRRLAHELGNSLDLLRLRWIEGRFAQESGDTAGAQAAFEQVRQEFDRLRLPYDFALASLDLALLRREQGLWRHVKALATEMVKTFEQHKVHRETVAAVLLFQEAAAEEAVTAELVRRLRSALETARRQPANLVEP